MTGHTGSSRREQIEFLANIVRLYRGEKAETEAGSKDLMKESFPKGKYADVLGLARSPHSLKLKRRAGA